MAWRDTRTSRRRLLLYTASITLGIAALVSIASFGESLQRAIRGQSSALLGADMVVSSRQPFPAEAEELFASLGGKQAREISFSSMVMFPQSGHARLVSVRAVEEGFPFYGQFETEPASAAQTFRDQPSVLVEENVLVQFGAKVGDPIKLGADTFTIAGALRKVPGESPGFSLVAARVYLPMQYLDRTQLLQRGSRIQHRLYLATPPDADVDRLRRDNRQKFREWDIRTDTVNSREANLGRMFENVERFLSLVGFVALLLGAIGVASGVHVFIRQKLASIAVLRCVGATTRQTFMIYLLQATGLGLIGALAGAAIGVGCQLLMARAVGRILPVEVEFAMSWSAVAQGVAAGVGVTLALALLPLLNVRRVSPLLAIRSTIEPPRGSWRDPATIAVVLAGLGAITAVAVQQTTRWDFGLSFVGGTAIAFCALAVIGFVLMRAARRLTPGGAPYVWRQGMANLFRPNNRTLLLILALGLGTFLIVSMQLTKDLLVGQLEETRASNRSNMVLFDIQSDQREGVRETIEAQGLAVVDEAPIVTMRLASVQGRSVADIRRDNQRSREANRDRDSDRRRIDNWVLNREYRSTFRRELADSEKLIAGEWIGEALAGGGPVPISLERSIAEELHVDLGDRLTFDVQGVPVECRVASLRDVDWRRVQPNFFVVFPGGVLEEAPQFIIMSTRVPDAATSGAVQRAMFERYPNVSIIDLSLVLETVDAAMEKISFAFWVMALFIVGTGLIVLAGVMASGRFQRLRESVLLRTIGASRSQIARIQLIEYLLLGTLASLAGVLLAWAASWALGRWIFELREAYPHVGPMLIAWIVVTALTVFVGWISGRRLLNHPPLEILRQEA